MNTRHLILSFIVLASFLLIGCQSPLEMVETGNYDEAIDLTLKRLAGKKKKKEELVAALERAFHAANQSDLNTADRLKAEYRPSNWPKIYNRYRAIQNRQSRVAPLLPLIDKEGIQANIQLANVDHLVREAKEKSATFYYGQGVAALSDARQSGDRLSARQAFKDFKSIGRYFKQYKDEHQLMDEAHHLGQSYVLVKMANEAPVILPHAFERELLTVETRKLDDQWRVFHQYPQSNTKYDYEVVVRLTDIDVSPERIQERQYEEVREIEDGFDYVLDANGNVMKDTLGNDIKVVRNVNIRAIVLEAFQEKAAFVRGQIAIYDKNRHQLVEQEPFDTEVVFTHYASTFEGDPRALSDKSRRYCDNQPIPFPTDEMLLMDATDDIKDILRRKISRSQRLL